MTDLELIEACAKALGFQVKVAGPTAVVDEQWIEVYDGSRNRYYDPLTEDAQAMALVKRFGLHITRGPTLWVVDHPGYISGNENLNRAIVECVARLTAQKG